MLDDFGNDPANAGAREANCAGGGGGQIKDPTTDERPAIIDGDDHATAAMGHAEARAKRQRAMGTGQGVLVETLAGGRAAAGLVAVIGGHAREATAAAGRDRRISVAPG